MTPMEVVGLVALVSQISPAQKIDEFTADAWHMLLKDVPSGDAKVAVLAVGRRQPFIGPSDIIAEVRAMRRERLAKADATFVPECDPDDTVRYNALLRAHRALVADGVEPAYPQLERAKPGFRERLMGVFRRPPRAERRQVEAAPAEPWSPPSAEQLAWARKALDGAARAAEGQPVTDVPEPTGPPSSASGVSTEETT